MSNGVVIGIRATGMLTTADYDRVLVPKGAELSQKFETLRALSSIRIFEVGTCRRHGRK